jgi:hypothetical protein
MQPGEIPASDQALLNNGARHCRMKTSPNPSAIRCVGIEAMNQGPVQNRPTRDLASSHLGRDLLGGHRSYGMAAQLISLGQKTRPNLLRMWPRMNERQAKQCDPAGDSPISRRN